MNQGKKLALLKEEGVEFDEKGMLLEPEKRWWNEFKV